VIIYNGYQIKPHKEHPKSYIIVTDGKGGKIPDVLGGMFTSPTICKAQVDKYLEYKEANNDKKGNKGGV
jgi:hypothetical protein